MNLSNDTYLISDSHRKSGSEVGAWFSQITARLHNLGENLSARRTRAREMRELHRFSDRELWDVGLNRSDITLIEKGIFRRDR